MESDLFNVSILFVCGVGLRGLEIRFGLLREQGFPLVLSLQAFLGFLQLLDVFRVGYYPMIHRSTNLVSFEIGVSLMVPLMVLMLFWVASGIRKGVRRYLVVPVVGLLFYPIWGLEVCVGVVSLLAVVGGLWDRRCFGSFLVGIFGLLSLVEGLALLHWVFFVPLGWVSPAMGVAGLEMGLFYISGYIAPLLILGFLCIWFLKPIADWSRGVDSSSEGVVEKKVVRVLDRSAYFLLALVLLSVFVAYYPYLPSINPDGRAVGVDYRHYVEAAGLVEGNLSQALRVMGGSRPMIFLLISGFQRVLGSDVSVAVKFLPVLLNPLLVLSVFFVALEVFRDDGVALWAAFFTLFGVQVTVGMYSYFLTNMLGLSMVLFSLGLLFRALRCGGRLSLVLSCLVGALLVFTHPWSFDQYFVAAVLAAGFVWFDVGWERFFSDSWMVVVYLVSLGFSEVLKMLVVPGGGGVSAVSTAIGGVSGLSSFWVDSIFSFRLLYGGTISCVVLLGLSVVGVYLMKGGGFAGRFFMVLPAVSSLLFLIGDEVIKTRLIYNLPLGLYAALGFHLFFRGKRIDGYLAGLATFIVLAILVYSFRSLANLV
ncbi:MAG: hypothetical protein QGF78_00295 [Candidatus Bathyarchaeota archaeon]|nr:hypothetical protein [Candidatus Bathyarchaeota archaeon]